MRITDRRGSRGGLWGAALLAGALATGSLGSGALATGALATGAAAAQAFPGADGYGAVADGWTGGKLIAVTSLADRGPGSLRACVEAKGPRVCIFRTSGTVELNTPLQPRSMLYVAGQTAPGDGIQLRMAGSRHGPLVIHGVHDIVVRFLKLRPGARARQSANVDAVTVENASRVYLGNLSMMFATDETANIHVSDGTASDITLADNIIALSLDHANHPDGRHSKGVLICSGDGTKNACGRISLLRNIVAHHRDRNPDVKATREGPVEVVNNIFYDPVSQLGEFYDLLGDARVAYVGNLAMTGPSSNDRVAAAVQVYDWTDGHAIGVWAEDNIAKACESGATLDVLDPAATAHALGPFPLMTAPMPAAELEARLPDRSGDVLPDGGHRDALDRRVIDDLQACAGRVIDRPDEVGGWPVIDPAEAPLDADGDLMPDLWEAAHGLNPAAKDDPWGDADGDGMPNAAAWLAELAGDA